tara:strand:- start:2058 stop:2753 length:696 start_codon:yes stop_codon:yes gene_type:complete
MNNYHYIAIQKAASWANDKNMLELCVKEFHAIKASETIDTKACAIAAAKLNGINPLIIQLFETKIMKTIVITTRMLNSDKTGVSAFIMCDADIVQTIKNIIESNSDAARKSESTYMVGATLSVEQLAASDVKQLPKHSNQDDKSAAIELKALLLANSTGAIVQDITSGHLSNNGGLRGHSAGDIFPWRVLITGKIDALKYWIVNPMGAKILTPYPTYSAAYTEAGTLKGMA